MEEKQPNKKKREYNPILHTVFLLSGMMTVAFISFYIPISIFALLIFAPFSLNMDMKQAKPILSIGLLVISTILLYFNNIDFALYIILVIITGVSSLACYVVWRFLNVKRFSDGLMYSVFATVLIGILTALIVFILRDRQPFAQEIVQMIEKWMRSADSVTIEYLYRYYNVGTAMTIAESQQALWGAIEGIDKSQMINTIMPFLQSGINQFSLSAMVLYPAAIGILTWWRGNAKFYKNQPMDEGNKELKPKPFSTFTIPRWLFTSVAIMLIVSFIVMISDYGEVIFNAAILMQNFAYILLTVQGLAVLEYFLKRNKVLCNAALRIISLALIMIISGGLIPMFIGGVDMFLNIRVVYTKAKELKKQMEQDAEQHKNENEDEK